MKRETSNRIRFVVEEMLPPIIRDSSVFAFLSSIALGPYVKKAADFRRRAPFLTEAEYVALYRDTPHVHDNTDNSLACLNRIAEEVSGVSVCDVGCGSGYLLRHVAGHAARKPERLVGCDIVHRASSSDGIEYHQAKVECLPFKDREFDTVICTHVLEHILDYRKAIAELRRITKHRLIVVVPMEREGLYTFNPHFNFFPYPHSFLRAMVPVPEEHVCISIDRDIFYMESHF